MTADARKTSGSTAADVARFPGGSRGPAPGRHERRKYGSRLSPGQRPWVLLHPEGSAANRYETRNDQGVVCYCFRVRPLRKLGPGTSPRDPGGKEIKVQGVSVRPTRKPKYLSRLPVKYQPRLTERRSSRWLYQDPPRTTRRPLSRLQVHAVPSLGAPS